MFTSIEKTDNLNETTEIALQVLNFKEQFVDKDIEKLEHRLNKRIGEVKEDFEKQIQQLNKRIDNLQRDLKWFVSIGLAVSSILVTVVVKFL